MSTLTLVESRALDCLGQGRREEHQGEEPPKRQHDTCVIRELQLSWSMWLQVSAFMLGEDPLHRSDTLGDISASVGT